MNEPQPGNPRPFQTVISGPARPVADLATSPLPADDGWSVDDIEAAYQRALAAADELAFASEPLDVDPVAESGERVTDAAKTLEVAGAAPESDTTCDPPALEWQAEPGRHPASDLVPQGQGELPITPRQIVEVFLFVGGRPLTVRQLADLLGGSVTPEQIEGWIAELNRDYSRQARPYEVRLTSGGYQLDLRPEFEKIRARVYGVGPREVKLAQTALEVLALVAYQQPVTRTAVEASGIQGAAAILRQLLRRELVALERAPDGSEPTYRTTPRFLELFGLRSLSDLPRAELVGRR